VRFILFCQKHLPQDIPLHQDFRSDNGLLHEAKSFYITLAVAAALLGLEYCVGAEGKFVIASLCLLTVSFIFATRALLEHLWRQYASWVYRTSEPVAAHAYFYLESLERHQQLLNIIYADGTKETVHVKKSRYDASKVLDQKQTASVRRHYATGGAVVVVDCLGRLFWCAPLY
jgi:hypothetical protein